MAPPASSPLSAISTPGAWTWTGARSSPEPGRWTFPPTPSNGNASG
ncbi:hypothetical protein ACEYXF_31975 [Streptomyces asiaticus]